MKNADYVKARGISFDSLVAQPMKGGKKWSIEGAFHGDGEQIDVERLESFWLQNRAEIGEILKNSNDESGCRAILRWLDQERKVLDAAETKYLAGVIRPFKDFIVAVWKKQTDFDLEHITIQYRDFDKVSIMVFPDFEAGTMYKGMELGRKYTLEELGL